MVVTQARESLPRVEVEIGPAGGVVDAGAARRGVRLVEAEDPQHVDERRIEMTRGQVQGFVRSQLGLGNDAERVGAASRRGARIRGATGRVLGGGVAEAYRFAQQISSAARRWPNVPKLR